MSNKSLVKLKISELNHGRILTKLSSEGIYVVKAYASDRDLVIVCRKKQLPNIIALFDRMCYNYILVEYDSPYNHFIMRLKAGGAVAAIALFAAFLSVISGYVLKIDVHSEAGLKNQVLQVLADAGVRENCKLNLSESEISAIIEKNVEGVSFASVKKSGCSLDVTLKESLPSEQFFAFDERAIRSANDAVITRVIVWSGTAKVKSGQAVKAGDVLISGTEQSGDVSTKTAASGEVYGKCYYVAECYFSEDETFTFRTGRSVKKTFLSFFGEKQCDFSSPYALYEKRVTQTTVGILLPYRAVTVEYFELERARNNLSFETVKDGLERQAAYVAMGKIPPSAKVLNFWTETKKLSNGYVVRVTVEAEKRIDVR